MYKTLSVHLQMRQKYNGSGIWSYNVPKQILTQISIAFLDGVINIVHFSTTCIYLDTHIHKSVLTIIFKKNMLKQKQSMHSYTNNMLFFTFSSLCQATMLTLCSWYIPLDTISYTSLPSHNIVPASMHYASQ